MEPLKVGLIGLGRCGVLAAEALLSSSWARLIAVGSQKAHRLTRFAESHPNVTTYDDFRSLIVNNSLDTLCVAVPPFARRNYLQLAAERRLPVWMLGPAARQLDEAMEVSAMFEAAGVPLVVSRAYGIEPALHEDTIGSETTGRVFLARGHVQTCLPDDLDWRGDSTRAGGGVILDSGYSLIDSVVLNMGMPGSVYTAAAGVSRPAGRFPYDTEDSAAIIFQYASGAIAQITACWTTGPEEYSLDFHGQNASAHIDAGRVLLRDRRSNQELASHDRPTNPYVPQLEEFLGTLRTSPRKLRSIIRQHVPTMAVIQAIYLSARTGQPESPGPILEMHQKKGARG